MTKPHYKAITPISQAEIIEPESWLNQLNKIHESGDPEIGTICGHVGYLAKKPKKRTMYEIIMDDLSSIKNDPDKFSKAVNCIEEVYQEIFYTQNAEIIPFQEVVGGAR